MENLKVNIIPILFQQDDDPKHTAKIGHQMAPRVRSKHFRIRFPNLQTKPPLNATGLF